MRDSNNHNLADRIKISLAWGKYTNQGLADEIRVDPATISQWRQGKSTPSYQYLVAVSDATGVDLNWLLKGEGNVSRA